MPCIQDKLANKKMTMANKIYAEDPQYKAISQQNKEHGIASDGT
jgi:hypothetical protein